MTLDQIRRAAAVRQRLMAAVPKRVIVQEGDLPLMNVLVLIEDRLTEVELSLDGVVDDALEALLDNAELLVHAP